MTEASTSAAGTTVQEARAAMAAQDARGHAARIARLSPVPVAGWLAFLPIDFLLTRLLYPDGMAVALGVRSAVGVFLVGLYLVVRKRPPQTPFGTDLLLAVLMTVLCAALAVIAAYCGGLASIHGAGVLIVMSVPSFVELPWQRGARVALAGLVAFATATIITRSLRGDLAHELSDARGQALYAGNVFLLLVMGSIAVVGGHLGHRLRQQVYESRSIGRYKLQRLLGRGGMGEVWAAYHQGLRRDVALKILRDAGPRAVSRFEREVQALADLKHPNTVRVFDYGSTDDGLLYYAMELLVGVDLGRLVKTTGPLTVSRAVHLVEQAARALGEAHHKGMIHRDIKPENLFIASAGGEVDFVKVLDFGIVRLVEDDSEALTHEGQIAGTPAFMAPEVGLGEDANPRSDVYALGAVLYFLLTGGPPFDAKGTAALLAAHRSQPVVPPSLRMSTPLPSEVEEIILACLSKDPEGRPKDAAALAEALEGTGVVRSHALLSEGPSAESLADLADAPSHATNPSGEEATRRLPKGED